MESTVESTRRVHRGVHRGGRYGGSVLDQVERVEAGGPVVRARLGLTPYTRMMTGLGPVVAYLAPDVVAWVGPGVWGPVACAVGPVGPAVRLIGALRATGALGDVRWLHLPRSSAADLRDHLTVRQTFDWDMCWLEGDVPGAHPAADRVEPLGTADEAAIGALLDIALPDSSARPGSPLVNGWYGVRDGDRLVACAADESRAGVGFLGGIAVDPAYRRQGLGAALTVTLTRRLAAELGPVALGVMSDNSGAIALYRRLGFTGTIARSSVSIS